MFNKFLGTFVTASLLFSNAPIVAVAVQASSPVENTNELVEKTEPTNAEAINSASQSSQFPSGTSNLPDKSTTTTSSNDLETTTSTESSTEHVNVTISFQTDQMHPFSEGKTQMDLETIEGKLTSIPSFGPTDQADLAGWQDKQGKAWTEAELKDHIFTQNEIFTAVFKKRSNVALTSVSESIKDVISTADKTKVITVPSPTGENYKEYPGTEAGVKEALFDMYSAGNNKDYVLYFGKNISIGQSTLDRTIPATIDKSTITFYSLQGKVNNLIITGNSEDPITTDTAVPDGSNRMTFASEANFGNNVTFRNMTYVAGDIFMNGHNLTLNGGSSGDALTIYGGSDTEDVVGDPTITVNATGSGDFNLYGGNKDSGTLKGNPTIQVNNTTGTLGKVVGGSENGTIEGDTSVTINDVVGDVDAVYGGGYGSSASKTADVKGNVKTTINIQDNATKFSLGKYYGGVNYGSITGSVHNELTGYGSWKGLSTDYVGGSYSGDIGTDRSANAISTSLDSSQFSDGTGVFVGANAKDGTITGSINNSIKAGEYHKGSLVRVDGGAGMDVDTANLQTGTDASYDEMTPQERKDYAEKTAKFKVYGNITTTIAQGMISEGADNVAFTRGAGYAGYIEGNTTVEVGTLRSDKKVGGAGFVYSSGGRDYKDGIDYKPSGSPSDYETESIGAFDIVGGGGSNASRATNIYIFGNTKTIHNNDLARWTYGGGFSGIIEGSTTNEMNAGMVSTLEGSGYAGKRVYGNTKAIVNYGEVDWFLSGGGWNDEKIVGDVGVEVHDGIINASMGASYGFSSDHTVTGNSHNFIYGGDFSGKPLKGKSGFSGGITNNGSLLGDANLTIDLRHYNGTFKLPSDTYVSGGRPFEGDTELGTSEKNTITLNIYLKDGVDSLAGANVYGDGGDDSADTKSGKITVNMQGIGSNVGHLYATEYSNIEDGKILRDVTANIQGATSIAGLSGGSEGDDFTNTIVKNSTNQVVYNFGADVDGTGVIQKDPIKVTGTGIINFTQLNVTNGLKLSAEDGNISNGGEATAASHKTTYNEFGDIHLSKNAGLGVVKAGKIISGGKLIVEDEGTLESPQGAGVINISDFETPNLENDRLTWIKNTTDTDKLVDVKGTWFGEGKGYQVLTINPTKENAKKLTPQNFKGTEKATGKTFIGDNDVTGTDGYGVMLPGSVIDYEVESPGIAEGAGAITHNVDTVKENNEPLSIEAWGTDVAGKEVQKGRLIIPYKADNQYKLSFIPDKTTGSWLYSGAITSTKVDNPNETIGESSNTDPVDWKLPDGEYSYQVKVKYSNEAHVTAQNILLKESEAQALSSKAEVIDLMKASGGPFLKEDIDLDAIKQPLAEGELSRTHEIHYSVGTTEGNKKEITANIVIIPDDSEVSGNKKFAVYAQNALLELPQANGLASIDELNSYTKAKVIFADGSPEKSPDLPQATFDAIKNTTAAELIKEVPTVYSYTLDGESVEKSVTVQIIQKAGQLSLKEVPSSMNFGTQKVSNKTMTYWPTYTGNLVVSDNRGSDKAPWRLMVRQSEPLKSATNSLADSLIFEKAGTDTVIGSDNIQIEEKQLAEDGDYTVNQNWSAADKTGIKLKVPVGKQQTGNYEGKLSWTLEDVPDNN